MATAKRSIILKRTNPNAPAYRYVLWADVPSGNQIAYRNPAAVSAYENASASELQALRDGSVIEKVGELSVDSGAIGTIRSLLDARWSEFQAQATAEAAWADYGSYSNASGVWQNSPGVAMYSVKEISESSPPTYIALTPMSSFGANKFHFILFNNAGATGQSLVIKVRLVVWKPGNAAVTGAAGGLFTLQRRQSPTTAPSGTGSFAIAAMDSATPVPSMLVAWNAPQTAPAGGSLVVINECPVQPDEAKASTADAPTLSEVLNDFGGMIMYRHGLNSRPLTIRSNETLEIQQSATAGTGNGRALVLFTVG